MAGEKNDYSEGIFLLIVLFIFGLWSLWVYKLEWFVAIWYIIKAPIFNAIAFIPKEVFDTVFSNRFFDFLGISMDKYSTSLYNVSQLFKETKFEHIYNVEMYNQFLIDNYNYTIKQYINFVNALTVKTFSPFVFYYLFKSSKKILKKEKFRKVHNVQSLGVQESKLWPQIRPVIYESDDFINCTDLDSGWFAMAAKPKDYMLKHDIIKEYDYEEEDNYELDGKKYFKMDVEKAYAVLSNELGQKWEGVNSLNFEEKAFLSIVLPKIMRDKKTSQKMNDNLAIMHSSYPEKVNYNFSKILTYLFTNPIELFKYINKIKASNKTRKEILKEVKSVSKVVNSDIDSIINKYMNPVRIEKKMFFFKKEIKNELNPDIEKILNSHFYTKTVFIALLKLSRKSGVLASCDLIWIKKINRDLWYTISQVGRTASFIECSGTWSHYLTELKVERKISTPMITNAIKAMDKYMNHTHEHYKKLEDDY